MKTVRIDVTQAPTDAQKKMLLQASQKPVTFDEDCPEFSKEELQQFKKISAGRQNDRVKQTVTLRLSPQALKKAKSLGKGYTSVLSRILEDILGCADAVQKYL